MTNQETKTVKLYRIENPTILAEKFGPNSHPDIVGQWFSADLAHTGDYLKKSTQTFGSDARVVDGAQLVVAQVPEDQLTEFAASSHPIAGNDDIDRDPDDYILPRDGSIPMIVIPLDLVIGEHRGKLSNVLELGEAKRKIVAFLAKAAQNGD